MLANDTVAKALLASRNRVIELALAEREARGEARGEARALAAAVLRVLARRDVSIDDLTRDRVLDCSDAALLAEWLDRAATARAASEVFG